MQDDERDAHDPEQTSGPEDRPADAPLADEPFPAQPSEGEQAHEPSAGGVGIEPPLVDEPRSEEPMVDEPRSEEPMADEPRYEEPVPEGPRSEEPIAEPAAAEEPRGETSAPSWPTAEYESAPPPANEAPIGEPAPRLDEDGGWSSTPPSEAEAFDAAPPTAWADAGAADEAVAPEASAHSVPATEVGESTQCPRCGTENRPGIAFCRNCGQRLIAAGVAATVERPGTPEGTQSCPRCGTHNRAGVAFCQNCGANLRTSSAGYVPPAVVGSEEAQPTRPARRAAILGPIVLLIGAIGIATAYVLPFAIGGDSLYTQAFGSGGYGAAFWSAYPGDSSTIAQQAYFGFGAGAPILVALLVLLAIGGAVRAAPRALQTIGLLVGLLWAVALIVLFAMIEVAGSWQGDLVGMLRDLSPAGIIFFLASLIVLIGTLTRFARA